MELKNAVLSLSKTFVRVSPILEPISVLFFVPLREFVSILSSSNTQLLNLGRMLNGSSNAMGGSRSSQLVKLSMGVLIT